MSMHIPESDLKAMYRRAYGVYPEWLAHLRQDQTPIAQETLTVCERLPEMASALFVAGYVTALVDTAVDRLPAPTAAGRQATSGDQS